jgi:hypothetical protein
MGIKRLGFVDYEPTKDQKRIKRVRFPVEMEAVVPWQALIGLIPPTTQTPARRAAALAAYLLVV